MKTLYYGSTGPQVQLLQLSPRRAGFTNVATDGAFGLQTQSALKSVQRYQGLAADGIAGPATHAALQPWYTGYVLHTLRGGDSFYRLAQRYATSVSAIAAEASTTPPGIPGEATAITLSMNMNST